MRFSFTLSAIIVLQLLFYSCQKGSVLSENQKILFQYSYTNSAWGLNTQGYLIDSDGNLLVYNNPDKWNLPDKNSIITQAQAAENISKCTATGKKVPQAELQKYANYIKNIASSKVTARKSMATGMGTVNYYCFSYSEINSTYKQIIIRTQGDFESENLNFFSKRVVEWMNQILKGLPVQHQ